MICIYPPACTDFSDNGLGTLMPISCSVTETLNGEYEVALEHPIDEAGNSCMTGEFPVLGEGNTAISWSGVTVTEVTVVPRWVSL